MNCLRIIFVNRYFHPDESATSQLLTELAAALAPKFDVRVLASRMLCDDARANLGSQERWCGIRIFRVWSTRFGRASLWGRAFDYLSFLCSVAWFLARNVTRGDIVVLKTDPPLLQLVNTTVVRSKGGKVVNWLQDLYPEIAIRLNKFPGPGWLARGLARWRDRALHAARANVVVSDAMARFLEARGVPAPQVIPNWIDGSLVAPIVPEANPLRAEWGLQGKFIVMYSGNFGRAHTFDEIAGAVQLLAHEPSIHFLFVGGGAGLDGLKQGLRGLRTGNFTFKDSQPRANLGFSLGVADLHLVTLRDGMEDLLMPSKVYGILAAGRPIGFVGNPEGDLGAMIRAENIGFVVPGGDPQALADAILRLKNGPAYHSEQAARARSCFESKFTREVATDRWVRLLDRVYSASRN